MESIVTATISFRDYFKRLTVNSLRINEKHNDLACLPSAEYRGPSLVRRNRMNWVEQIAGLQEKKKEILSEITAIEQKHSQMRKANKLRKAAATEGRAPPPTRRSA